jgi:hypothetical protein
MARSIKACLNCGEAREMAAHGLCFSCYRVKERKVKDDLWARPDQHAKEIVKTQRNARKALMKMMDAIEELEAVKMVPVATTDAWRLLLRPEVERIALSLGGAGVNGEHKSMSEPFTWSADDPGERINSEQQSVTEQFTESADIVSNQDGVPNKVSAELTKTEARSKMGAEDTATHDESTQVTESLDQPLRNDHLSAKESGIKEESPLPPGRAK